MSKKNHFNHNDQMVDCPRCEGKGNLGKSSTAHVYAVETCPLCKGQKRLPVRQVEKIYNRVWDAIFEMTEPCPDTPEEVDQYLRANGYDPDEMIARMRPRIQKALDESPLNPKNQEVSDGTD